MMDVLVPTKDGMILINAPYQGYIDREGHFKIEIGYVDSSTIEKGYIVAYLVDKGRNVILKANLRTVLVNPEHDMPLEKFFKLALKEELDKDWHLFAVDFELLLGLECQILVKRESNYYNIYDVFPMDEELGEYVSEHDKIKCRYPKGLFNHS